jgi:hypothetical protein
MGFLDRLFGKKRNVAPAEFTEASARPAGKETGQTADEQAATRRAMEAEMTAQRDRRAQANSPQE